jgi:MAF protein
MQIILASSSPYRRAILDKLQIPFQYQAPDVEESPKANEDASTMASRLAIAKAKSVAKHYTDGLIIGSDQVACIEGKKLGKPGNHEAAHSQLIEASGKSVMFYTGLCVINAQTNELHHLVEPFEVKFKTLSASQIERYLRKEQPYDCAGSFKCEGLGIVLFEELKGRDPNALVGLPLIGLCELFAKHQFEVL